MKSTLVSARLFTLLIFFCLTVSAQNFQTVRDGIEYAELTRQMKSAEGKPENVVFHLMRLDLTKVRLDVVHALDAAIGLEKTSSIATRHGAFAAINAGFFRIDKSIWEGDDVGVLQIDGKLLSEPSNKRIILGIFNGKDKTEVGFDHLSFAGYLDWNKQKDIDLINGINRQRKENEVIAYTPEFAQTTLTDPSGIEIIVRNNKVTEIYDSRGSSLIPYNGFVLSGSGETVKTLRKFKTGDVVKLQADIYSNQKPDVSGVIEDIVSGVPQLIKNSEIKITWQEEKQGKAFVETHHPRTAVAKLKDGKFLMVVVDGRSEASGGIGLPDLAAFLLEQGATDAMNLDGGGSSTMFLDGKVVNRPSDKEGERKIGDAILVFPR